MSLAHKFNIWKFPKTRLETFSDGVFAIIITLLVLEIKVPHVESMKSSWELFHAIEEIFPVLYSWVISVLIVGTLWLNHHNVLHMAKRADYGMVWINTIFLLFAALIPFPTHLMGAYPHIPLAVASLGFVLALASASFIWLYYYVTKNYLKDEYDYRTTMRNVRWSFILAPMFYILAALMAWAHTYITFIIYACIPFLFMLPLDRPKSV